MKVSEYLTTFNLEHDSPYDNAVLLKHINLLEANLDVIKDYRVQAYARVKDAYQYDLPSGVSFDDVYGLRVNGIRYKKVDVREYKKLRTFWFENGKLCIYPACTETDNEGEQNIRLIYKYRPATKLIANIATDDLYIPDRFADLYDSFLSAKIAFLQKEFTEHNNYMIVYNSRLSDFEQWWENNRPMSPESEIVPDEDYSEPSGFDYE
jgi:hypothetical protein